MIPLIHSGILKAIDGQTSLEEIYRVCGDISYAEELYQSLLADKLDNKIILDNDLYDNIQKALSNFEIIQDLISKSTTKTIFQIINICALLYNASDIHIEPQEDRISIRYRIDGILTDKFTLPKEEYISFVSYLKQLINLETDAGNIKEGRYSVEKDTKTDIRVSIVPSGYGETIVLRFLKTNINLDLDSLGFDTDDIEKIYTAKNNPSGIILACGPTSSGKTTTIYSILKLLNDKSKKILTIEDPIEYTVDNVIQTQVDIDKDYTFSNALKGFLRQNPDIILVGEIRDKETAQVAVQASLTGHLILSTLHTIDISSSLLRLQNFDINKEELLNSINCLIAQRLSRRLCPHCKKKVLLNNFQKEKIQQVLNITPPEYIYEAVGCEQCSFTGYKGQIGLFEVLVLNDSIRKQLTQSLEDKNFKETIYSLTDSLLKDALNKLIQGNTDVKEIERVLGNKIF
ncbi:MAG: GspE/PulE family protein [Candidatus Pacebacteria bacterium]|nr:GspE/PulE family protein [Candidatus Paceibacterota bacterium]